jgi:branched-chain amino acid transport system ATP-binding protein
VQALDNVTLELHRHEVVGLIGPNGAGKSTLVNVLTGFDVPTSGSVDLDERDVTRWSPHKRGRAGIARTFQHSRSFRGLTVRENIEVSALGAGARPAEARTRAGELIERLALDGDATAGGSARARASAGVARALATKPAFVLLDEPGAGLRGRGGGVRRVRAGDPRGLRRRVLLIDHNMALVMEVSDRIHVLDRGKTLAEGAPAEIRGNLDVTSAYLGESAVAE